MYNLIECSDNYSHTSGSLWQFKRDEHPIDNNGAFINITDDTVADEANRKKENVEMLYY